MRWVEQDRSFLIDGVRCWSLPPQRQIRDDEKYHHPSARQLAATKAEITDDPVIQALMPMRLAEFMGTDVGPDLEDEDACSRYEQSIKEEQIAYGMYLIDNGIDHDGMFHSACVAKAMQSINHDDRVCEAIVSFDIDGLIKQLELHYGTSNSDSATEN